MSPCDGPPDSLGFVTGSDEELDGGGVSYISYDGEYTLTWGSVDRAVSYALLEAVDGVDDPNGPIVVTTIGQGLSAREYGKSYSYKVKACLGASGVNGCTIWSNSLSVEVKPNKPAGLGSSDGQFGTDGEYTLTWSDVDADTGTYYKVQERSAAVGSSSFSGWTILLDRPSSASYDISKTGADFEKKYEYQVRACAANNACGDWSESYGLSLEIRPAGFED